MKPDSPKAQDKETPCILMQISHFMSSHCPITMVPKEKCAGTGEFSFVTLSGGWDGLAAPFKSRETEAQED